MPMPHWEDEDEYLTYMSKVLERLQRDDPQPNAETRLARYIEQNWIDLFAESVGEADGPFFTNCLTAYQHDDLLVLGRLVSERIREYAISCAEVWNIIDEGELDDE